MFRLFFFFLFIVAGLNTTVAQELRCNVVINDQQIQATDKLLFREMQASISSFMNTRKWTNETYALEERINSNIVITLTQMPSIGTFKATAQIMSSRPIYGTSHETIILNYIDKDWEFEYAQAQPMDFNENAYTSSLTSLLSFYAYMIIGYDHDTFSKLGGRQFYSTAQIIANNAQQNQGKGWSAFEGQTNRYWLLENMLSAPMIPFRESVYNYHRLGLDTFIQSPDKARAQTLEMLTKVKTVLVQKPMSVLINNFFDAKSNELISIFTQATPQEKQNAYNLLSQLDPTKNEQYQKLIK